MTTIQIQTQLSFETLLNSLQQLEPAELDQLAQATSLARARKRAPNLTAVETTLLQKIQDSTIPSETRQRCAELTQTQAQRPLSASEREKLAELVDQMELLNAQRLRHLIALADLRQVTLDELMRQLEIKPLTYE
jgi:hypothetical protein